MNYTYKIEENKIEIYNENLIAIVHHDISCELELNKIATYVAGCLQYLINLEYSSYIDSGIINYIHPSIMLFDEKRSMFKTFVYSFIEGFDEDNFSLDEIKALMNVWVDACFEI